MRMRFIVAAAAAIMFAAPAFAQPGHDPLPRNETALRELNAQQLRILRRASRLCAQTAPSIPIKAERNPCVIASTDKAISDTGDEALEAFHAALPDNERYDEYRADTTWRAFLVSDPN